MKIVVKKNRIKEDIDEYIDLYHDRGDEIVRIEMSRYEMQAFVKSYFREAHSSCPASLKYDPTLQFLESGSYIMYRGVCIQYHSEYHEGDFGVVYI